MQTYSKMSIPRGYRKEFNILTSLGVADYEIEYLIYLKRRKGIKR